MDNNAKILKMRKWVVLVLVSLLGLSILNCNRLREYKQKVDAIVIDDIDLQQVNDGEYIGECDMDLVRAKVLVKVKDHRITEIELLEHDHGRGENAEVIPEKVVEVQSLKVDTITGATCSSKIILEAIEDALKKGMN